jgi:hypothetical protein
MYIVLALLVAEAKEDVVLSAPNLGFKVGLLSCASSRLSYCVYRNSSYHQKLIVGMAVLSNTHDKECCE